MLQNLEFFFVFNGIYALDITNSGDLHNDKFYNTFVNFIPSEEEHKTKEISSMDLLNAWKVVDKKCAILWNIFGDFRKEYKSTFRSKPECCTGKGSTIPMYHRFYTKLAMVKNISSDPLIEIKSSKLLVVGENSL